jgi:hypothetical protein
MGSASCLHSLKILNVEGNTQLGGVIDGQFLANCEWLQLATNGCMQLVHTCIATGCSNDTIDTTVCYCADHVHCLVAGCLNDVDGSVCGSGYCATAWSMSTIRWGRRRLRW